MRVRPEHWQVLLQVAENNPELITNKFHGPEGKAKLNIIWKNVSNKLNSMRFGEKNVEGWRKALVDWKSKTKSKAAALRLEQQRTGGGPPELSPLLPLEQKLLDILGTKAVEGDRENLELGFGQVKIVKMTMPKVKQQGQPASEMYVDDQGQSRSNIFDDHDYEKSTILNTSLKRKTEATDIKETPSTSTNSKKRIKRRNASSNELMQMTKQSLQRLESIQANTESMADSLKIIANITQQYYFQK